MGEKKYIVTKTFGVIELTLFTDGLWRSADGTIFALRRDSGAIDPVDQCGISPFAIPTWLTPDGVLTACRVHDYMYESPAFQMFHKRSEADEYLKKLVEQNPKNGFWRGIGKPFRWLSRKFGKGAWENPGTND